MNKLLDDQLIECAKNNYNKGRLSALKDEEEWLRICYKRIVKIIIVDNIMENNPTAVFIQERLSQIQKEMKEIENV